MPKDRIGLSFHESFALSIPSVRAILRLSHDNEGRITPETIRDQTHLGPNYVKSMPQYARASGLIEMVGYRLTPLGEVVCLHDPNLENPTTLWAMHYHLSAPQGPGPTFWSHLVTKALNLGDEVSVEEVAEQIWRFQATQTGNVAYKQRTVRTTATVFLGTYTKSDGLGPLGLMRMVSGRHGYVRLSEWQSPPVGVVAFALADYWATYFGDQVTVSLSELAKDDGFARLMWMNYRQLDEVLMALKRENIVDLYRVAPPYQLVRRWSNKGELLARLYE